MANRDVNIKNIQKQSRHTDIQTLLGYIQPTDKETKNEYVRGISINNEEPQPIPHQTPKKQPEKPIIQEDNTDKYIALLKDGLISAEDFRTLVTSVKPSNQNYIQ